MKVTIKKQIVLVSFLLLIPVWVAAQGILVKGTVKDKNGESLVGVNILESGTKNATITDLNGNFTIKVPKTAKLNLSYIGYNKKSVAVDGRTVLVIELEEESKSLTEVVVVGYGKMKRTDVTGSISTVNSEAISKSVVTSLDQVLQGRAAGVQVSQSSGEPGGGVSVQIRGLSTLSGSSQPIYVIDGIIIDGGSSSSSNPLAAINPNDIVSMDILKDASATAIYGSRAAAGVIQITTKRGKKGESRISYNGYVGMQEMPKKLDLMNLQQYATLKNQQAAAGVLKYNNNFVRPDLLGPGTDWQDELFSKAMMTSHNLSVSGGSDKSTYAFNLGYLNQDGIAVGSGFKRYTLRGNIDTQLKKWLKSGVDFSFYNTNQKLTVSDESLIKIAMKQTPDVAARNAEGNFDGPQTTEYVQTNPLGLALLKENYADKTGVSGNTYLEATLFKGLTFKTEVNFGFGMDNSYKFTPTYSFGALVNNVTQSDRSKSYSKSWTYRNILTYINTLDKVHTINMMLGRELQYGGWEYLSGSRTGFVSNVSHDLSMGDGTTATNSGGSYFSALSSYFGRMFYSFDDRYLLTATLRYDGSSKLAHRWDWFPSLALAWKLSNESFIKDIPSIYNLKLRLGWGLVGNQNATLGGNYYPYTSVLAAVQTNWGTGLLSSNTPNPDISWEKTKSTNIGVDLGLFKNRIDFTADAYYKSTDGLLLHLPLPAYVGTTGQGSTTSPVVNVGSIENKGFEFSLNTINIDKKDFSWKSNFIFSLNRSKVLSLNSATGVLDGTVTEGSETTVVTRTAVGQTPGLFYGYKVIGRFEKATDFYYKDGNGVVKPVALPTGMSIGVNGAWIGDYIFQDVNKDGIIDEKDRTYIGNPAPDFTYSIGNTFSYKNWDLSIMLNGVYGNEVVNYQRRWLENPRSTTNLLEKAMHYAVLSKIDPNGPVDYRNIYISSGDGDMCRMAASAASSTSNFRFSDRFVEDGSFLRIQNISIGYNLPQSVTKILKIENLKLYSTIQNVYTFTVYKGYDPETGAMSPLLNGIDNARYPSPRIYTFGLNLTF